MLFDLFQTHIVEELEYSDIFSVSEIEQGENSSLQAPRALSSYFLIELVLAASLLIIFSPVMVLIALRLFLVREEGPIFYTQQRVGLGGKYFTIYKFRTMYCDAEQNGPQITTDKNDARITSFGRMLRKTHLDELPQLLNVINGDMSFIGPRPERPCFHEMNLVAVDGWEKRLSVKPGISGLAQVDPQVSHNPHEKIVLDLYYINNRSLLLDVRLMLMTVRSIFRRPENRLVVIDRQILSH